MALLTLHGVTLAYDDRPADGGGPPFVFLPEWLAGRDTWAPQLDDIGRSFRAISVDLPGTGESSPPHAANIDDLVATVSEFVEQLELGPSVLVGHGLGALIAMLVGREHPELVRGCALANPWISPLKDETVAGLATAVRTSESTAPVSNFLDEIAANEPPGEVRAARTAALESLSPDTAAEFLDSVAVLAPDIDSLLKHADRKPLMALWPGKPLGSADELRRATVFLRQEPVPSGSHYFSLMSPDATSALLRAFADDVERDPRLSSDT